MPRLVTAAALAAALIAAGCGESDTSGEDRPERSATLLLDFQPNAVHAGIYSATRRGYDEAEGVNLRVRVPASGTDSTKLLLAGRTDLAVLDIHDAALARENGRDVACVMAIVQRPLAAVLAQPAVRTPRDLEGRRVGVTGLPSDDAVLRSVVQGAGGDPNEVRTITIGFNAVQSLLTERVDGATAFWNVEGVAFREKRPQGREFRVDRFGAPPYPELLLCVARDTLTTDPSVVRATVRALARGYRFTLTDPQSSLGDLLAANRSLEREDVAKQLDALDSAFLGAAGEVGVLDPAVLEEWSTWEAEFGITKRPPDVEAMFEPRFAARAAADEEG
jgi:ABC-type nitrate/sulfonate/bicarbonate transport system substrate-binding protein